MAQQDWAGSLVHTVAGEVRRHRQQRGLSTQGLADACEQLGYPIKRQVLANLESGRREAISVPELLVLGRALGVPPALLVFPVGEALSCEPLPNQSRPLWETLQWFGGFSPYPVHPDANARPPFEADRSLDEWEAGATALIWYTKEDRLIESWHRDREKIATTRRELIDTEPEDIRKMLADVIDDRERMLRDAEEEIRKCRNEMRNESIKVRPLPEKLTHIEEVI
ncbi:helix-turn-helix transcriptional regulator [Saccharopolyspora shandongensis]|uniref:helix-turn-helix domain-containing protein n=1 Tax=Saccharopolyspora shandongensis TaxID=418495 RepID=UPI00344540DD